MSVTYGQTMRALQAEARFVPYGLALAFAVAVVAWNLWLVSPSLPDDVRAVAVDGAGVEDRPLAGTMRTVPVPLVSAVFLAAARERIHAGQPGYVLFQDARGRRQTVAARVSEATGASGRVLLEPADPRALAGAPPFTPRVAVVRTGVRAPLERLLSGDEGHAEEGGGDLIVETSGGAVRRLVVEVASTPAQRRRGLMHRDRLPGGHGMLLVQPRPGAMAIWMKDTAMPLDVLFIGPDHRVLTIVRDLQPFDLRRHWSDGPAVAALELNAGEASTLGIGTGDRIFHPALTAVRASDAEATSR